MLSSNGYINSQLFQDIRCTAFTGYTTIAMLRYRYATGCNYKGSRRRDIKGSHLVTTGAYDIHNIKHLLIEGCGFFTHCQSAAGDFIDTLTLHPQCREKSAHLAMGGGPVHHFPHNRLRNLKIQILSFNDLINCFNYHALSPPKKFSKMILPWGVRIDSG